MSEPNAFQRLDDAASDQPYPGVRRHAAQGERATLLRYTFEVDAAFPTHQHVEEQITLVERGELEFSLDGDVRRVGEGDIVVVPPNVPHGARACYGVEASLIAVLSPRREDIAAVSVVSD